MEESLLNSDTIITDTASISFGAGVVVVLFILILLIVVLIVLRRFLTRPELHGLTRDDVARRWQEIERTAQSGTMGAKMAIMEADKLLDGVLKSMSVPGETLGERLKFAGYKYPELRHVWYAHKLRNQIVHETSFEIGPRDAKSALQAFQKALKTLHVL
jgi:hypothetical protein